MFESREGQRVPEVIFRTRGEGVWVDVSSSSVFKGRRVVVFSLPGAFTPTCSSVHVPRYQELAKTFKANGVDEIVCISVNDGFVMKEWALDQKAPDIRFLPDGNGEFTAAMGMLVHQADEGLGMRSWRYSMLVEDGVIVKMFIEPNIPGDPFEVSDADTMLDFINPQARKPHAVLVFSREGCPFCLKAKGMLHDAGMEFSEVKVYEHISLMGLRAATQRDTIPQVFIDGLLVGGTYELQDWLKKQGH
jgi:glutaredoxin-like protein